MIVLRCYASIIAIPSQLYQSRTWLWGAEGGNPRSVEWPWNVIDVAEIHARLNGNYRLAFFKSDRPINFNPSEQGESWYCAKFQMTRSKIVHRWHLWYSFDKLRCGSIRWMSLPWFMPSDHSLQVFEFMTDLYHNLLNIRRVQCVEKAMRVNVFKGPAGMFVLRKCLKGWCISWCHLHFNGLHVKEKRHHSMLRSGKPTAVTGVVTSFISKMHFSHCKDGNPTNVFIAAVSL